jgi:Arc/MetJ-type ribon-helix-helix transcriptional regulator
MAKDKIIAVRVTDEQLSEIEQTRKELSFNSLSEFILFLWDKFNSGRKEKK